ARSENRDNARILSKPHTWFCCARLAILFWVSKANFSSLPVRETSFGFALQARRLALFAKGRAKSRTAPLPQPGCRALLARASRDSECPRGTDRPAKFSALNPSRA